MPTLPLRWLPLALAAPLALTGCAALRWEEVSNYLPPDPRGVIITADGAGGFQTMSAAFRRAVQEAGLPLAVEPFEWSHGRGRVLADQVDGEYSRAAGGCLAARVAAYRRACPGAAVFLVGHSAGSAVVLAAAESLPPDTITRMVLLAPSVSADYDLRPALRACAQGIDVYYSRRDVAYLGVGVGIVGTADRRWTAAAGRVGFCVPAADACDAALYARLWQHPWNPCVAWSGNGGGHYGSHEDAFLKAYVLPLLMPPAR